MGNGITRMIKNICLHNTIKEGNLEKVKNYIKQGADKDSKDGNGMTPLHWATKKGCIGIVKYLVEQGANISIRDVNGRSPEDVANERGHQQIADYLRELAPQRRTVADSDEPKPTIDQNWKLPRVIVIILALLLIGIGLWCILYGVPTLWPQSEHDGSTDSDRPPSEEL